MIIFMCGELHGRIQEFYDSVLTLEKTLGIKADWLLQVGNFGIYPDPAMASYQAKKNGYTKEFASLYLNSQPVPRNTLFVSGSHEDHRWMNLKASRGEMEILPNLHWLINGYSTVLEDNEDSINILGIGKVFSPAEWSGQPMKSKKVNKRLSRYTRSEVEKACSQGPVDLVLAHQSPAGQQFAQKVSDSQGLIKALYATRAKFLVHGCYNFSKEYYIKTTGTTALSLRNMEIVPYEYHNKRFTKI